MQSKKWKFVIFFCVTIHLIFSVTNEEINNSKGENMNIKNMEIILDHNLSEEELRGHNPRKYTRDEYIKEYYNRDFETAQDEAYEDIYEYYLYDKKDKKTAKKYFNKLSKERQKRIEEEIKRDRELLKDPRYNL